jgi:hypothetical protein
MNAPLAKGMLLIHRHSRFVVSPPTAISCTDLSPFGIATPFLRSRHHKAMAGYPARQVRTDSAHLTGLIIAASVLVAAGIAIYENEQLRLWIDERRRRIAIALYNAGDGIHPQPPASDSERTTMMELNRNRRMDIVRRNRMELIRRAQEQGIAVDLDELSALGGATSGLIDIPVQEVKRHSRGSSFEDFIGADGKVKPSDPATATASAISREPSSVSGLRHRGLGARGFDAGASFANPFDDEAHVLFDQSMIAPSEDEFEAANEASSVADTGTIRSVTPRPASTVPSLIEIPIWSENLENQDGTQGRYKTDDELNAEIEEAIRRSLQDLPMIDVIEPTVTGRSESFSSIDSLYSPPTPRAIALQEPLEPVRLGSHPQLVPEMSQLPASLALSPVTASSSSATISPSRVISPEDDAMEVDTESISAPTSVSEYMSLDDPDEIESDLGIDRAATPRSVSTLSSATFGSSETRTLDGESEFDVLSRPETPALAASASAPAPASAGNVQTKDADDDNVSESEYSVVGNYAPSTTGSWTDVDTDGEEEGNGMVESSRR